jgi:hypothetical protein
MSPSPALTVSRVEVQRSRQLIRDSRVRIASAKEFIHQSRRTISQQTMRWKRVEGAPWGQISHSICFACFAYEFRLPTRPRTKAVQRTRGAAYCGRRATWPS